MQPSSARRRTLALALVLTLALAVGACGGSDGDAGDAAPAPTTAATTSAASQPTSAADDLACMGVKHGEMVKAVGVPVGTWTPYASKCGTAGAKRGEVSVVIETNGTINASNFDSYRAQVAKNASAALRAFDAAGVTDAYSIVSLPEKYKGASADAKAKLADGRILHVQIFLSDATSPLVGTYQAQGPVEALLRLAASRI
jgi:hypothetical protein